MKNPNHPKKGSRIKVEPIKKQKDINSIRDKLKTNPRDLCLFNIGTNTNLRASDILQITVNMVKDIKPGDEIELKEKKTGKIRRITLNKKVVESIQKLLESKEYKDNDPLFLGQRGKLTVPYISRLVKIWCKDLKGNYGSHSLRKTFGYHKRQKGYSLEQLMLTFNHSNPKQTLDYLCIQSEEIKKLYMDEI
jgi:integrase